MATLNVTVCDKCKSMDKPTPTYTIEGGGMFTTLDLCKEDARGLVEYQHLVPKPVVGALELSRPPAMMTSRTRARVVTMEELEKLKAKGEA